MWGIRMIYLLASFVDSTKNNELKGFRCINVTESGISKHFDLELKYLVDLVEAGKLEIFKVKNRFDLESWASLVSMFDINTKDCLNEIRYVKLSDTEYVDCLGKRYTARTLAELDNFVSDHEFTNLENSEDGGEPGVVSGESGDEGAGTAAGAEAGKPKKSKAKAKKDRSDEEIIYRDNCGLGNYDIVAELTEKYGEFLDSSDDVEIELLDIKRVGRFSLKLSDKKEGVLKPCKDRRTNLYGVCCAYDSYVWVIVEPVYLSVESVQSGSSCYVAGYSEKGYWEFIDIKKRKKSEKVLDWCSTNNLPGKTGKLFVAMSGNLKIGYKWYLVGKGMEIDRQIGCSMVLTDALFTNIRGYTKHTNAIEFYDPKHGDGVVINLKDYSMDCMFNFRKSLSDKPSDSEEEVVLYYDIICDSTSGEIYFVTDKQYMEGTIVLTDINGDFITSVTGFLKATPKCETKEIKVKRHMAKRTQYTFQKVNVDLALKFKDFLSCFVGYTSAKLLGAYWVYSEITELDAAIADMQTDMYDKITVCDDGKDFYAKLCLLRYTNKSLGLFVFTRRTGKIIRVEYASLMDNMSIINENLDTALSIGNIDIPDNKICRLFVSESLEESVKHNVESKPTVDIIQLYRKNKQSLKWTAYRKVTELKLLCSLKGTEIGAVESGLEAGSVAEESSTDALEVYLTTYDGLDFRTYEEGFSEITEEDRSDIEVVRKHVKIYNKLMDENRILLSGYHGSAFKVVIN